MIKRKFNFAIVVVAIASLMLSSCKDSIDENFTINNTKRHSHSGHFDLLLYPLWVTPNYPAPWTKLVSWNIRVDWSWAGIYIN